VDNGGRGRTPRENVGAAKKKKKKKTIELQKEIEILNNRGEKWGGKVVGGNWADEKDSRKKHNKEKN